MEMKSILEPQGNNTVEQTLYLSSLCFINFVFAECHIQYDTLRIFVHDTSGLAALIGSDIAMELPGIWNNIDISRHYFFHLQ